MICIERNTGLKICVHEKFDQRKLECSDGKVIYVNVRSSIETEAGQKAYFGKDVDTMIIITDFGEIETIIEK